MATALHKGFFSRLDLAHRTGIYSQKPSSRGAAFRGSIAPEREHHHYMAHDMREYAIAERHCHGREEVQSFDFYGSYTKHEVSRRGIGTATRMMFRWDADKFPSRRLSPHCATPSPSPTERRRAPLARLFLASFPGRLAAALARRLLRLRSIQLEPRERNRLVDKGLDRIKVLVRDLDYTRCQKFHSRIPHHMHLVDAPRLPKRTQPNRMPDMFGVEPRHDVLVERDVRKNLLVLVVFGAFLRQLLDGRMLGRRAPTDLEIPAPLGLAFLFLSRQCGVSKRLSFGSRGFGALDSRQEKRGESLGYRNRNSCLYFLVGYPGS